ncbi:MAG: HDIG domain-containing metalloprotein [Candidatus Omnitrophota bacterium]
MTGIITLNKVKLIFGAALLFFLSYVLRVNFAIPLFLLSLFAYLKFSQKQSYIRDYKLLDLSLLFTLVFVSAYFVVGHGKPVFYIPFCAVPMLAVILFNELRVSLLLTVAGSFVAASVAGNDFHLGILFMISGLLSSVLVFGARRRSVIIRTGLIIGVIQAVTLFLIEGFKFYHPDRYIALIANGVISSVIVVGTLPVFEYLFKTVTNISLLELADFNQPLLQRMTMEAPGTYHHSLIVGNLSDAACQAVGANALLARIGAYYHDIGKLAKPEYFSENLSLDIKESKHDGLPPALSKLVIMNHVKEGADLAKKYKLNPCLVDFIEQHHGNSLVFYFYRRALESLEENQEVSEEGFRYPGPKPKTKETAIVLLADSVEAASRALKEPNSANIKELVYKVINNKFIDGQLDECDLTLKDLEKISAVFVRILSGIYHSRITYPENPK